MCLARWYRRCGGLNRDCLNRDWLNRDWKQTEHHSDAKGLQFNFLFACVALKIIERDVRWFVPMEQSISDPGHIFDKLGRTDSSEAHPQPTFVQRKYTAAPA